MCKGSNNHPGRILSQPLLRYTNQAFTPLPDTYASVWSTGKELSMDSKAPSGTCCPGELLAPTFSHVKCQQNRACPPGYFTCVCTGNHCDSLLRLLRGNKLTVPLGHPVLCVGVCARGALNPGVLPKLSLLISLQLLQALCQLHVAPRPSNGQWQPPEGVRNGDGSAVPLVQHNSCIHVAQGTCPHLKKKR